MGPVSYMCATWSGSVSEVEFSKLSWVHKSVSPPRGLLKEIIGNSAKLNSGDGNVMLLMLNVSETLYMDPCAVCSGAIIGFVSQLQSLPFRRL